MIADGGQVAADYVTHVHLIDDVQLLNAPLQLYLCLFAYPVFPQVFEWANFGLIGESCLDYSGDAIGYYYYNCCYYYWW